MLRSSWPNFPFSIEHLETLSDEQQYALYVSAHSLYVLQNAVQGHLINPRNYAETLEPEQYLPTRPDLPGWSTYLSVIQGLKRDLVEIDLADFNFTLYQDKPVATTIFDARYQVIGNMVLATIRCISTAVGTPGFPIAIANIPNVICAKYPVIVGYGQIYTPGDVWRLVSIHNVVAGGDMWQFIGNIATNWFGIDPAITLANQSALHLNLTYER